MVVVYKARLFSVERKRCTYKGRRFVFDNIIGPDTVAVLPILGDGSIILEKQYRYTIGKSIYEVPAGHMDKGENPKEAAARELKEETGYDAKSIKYIFSAYVAPGTKTEMQHYFIAKDLEKGKTNREPDEFIRIVKVSVADALAMIENKSIIDLKTIALLLFFSRSLT